MVPPDQAKTMKFTPFILPAVTGILGLALGLALAPSASNPVSQALAATSAGFPKNTQSTDAGAAAGQDDGKINVRTRARERIEDKKPKEPSVSIPRRSLVENLKKGELGHSSQFDCLQDCMGKTLNLLGATEREQEDIKNLIQKSKSGILTAEQNHLRLGEVTANEIHMDTSGMRAPVNEIIGQTKDGIRAVLPDDVAETLIESIDWDRYYPIDDYASLEITRSRGQLMAVEKTSQRSIGRMMNRKFKDDGTPLPADQIFGERWKSLLKGVTILPKEEEHAEG